MTRLSHRFYHPFLVLFLLSLAVLPAAAQPAGLEGRWEGAIEVPGAPLQVDIDFELGDSGWIGDISIPSQGASDLPLSEITLEGSQVSFQISGIGGNPTFQGELQADTIAGEFTQGPGRFPFRLQRGVNPAAAAKGKLKDFDAFLEQALKEWKAVGLAVAIVVGDDAVYAKGFGHRDLERQLPVTADTLFAIGSATKAFTAFTLATLVDQGKMDWDRPVAEYLPGWRLYDDTLTGRVTPRDLVTHRTGLPRHDLVWYNNAALTRADLFQRLRYLQPNKDLRETFQYNNHMFAMAGYLIEQLTGRTWEEAVRLRVLAPLQMLRSNFSVVDSQQDSDHAIPYQVHDEKIEKMAFREIQAMGPAGSINSSVNEMSHWLSLLLKEGQFRGVRLLAKEALAEMHTPQMAIRSLPREPEISPGSYGLGWFLNSYRGHFRVQHGGNIDGFSALVTYFPNDNLGIVALANQNGSALPGLATNHAADLLLDLEAKDWNAEALKRYQLAIKTQKEAEEKKTTVQIQGTSPSHPLADYAGEYSHPGYGTLVIHQDEAGALSMEYNGIRAPLGHWHYDVFNGLENPDDRTFEDMKLTFNTNLKGYIDSISAPFEPAVDLIRFSRRPDRRLSDPAYLTRFEGVYVLGPQTLTVRVRGNLLTLSLPGQPTYELAPEQNDEFNLKGLTGFSIQFRIEEDKALAILSQPNGVFTAQRQAP